MGKLWLGLALGLLVGVLATVAVTAWMLARTPKVGDRISEADCVRAFGRPCMSPTQLKWHQARQARYFALHSHNASDPWHNGRPGQPLGETSVPGAGPEPH